MYRLDVYYSGTHVRVRSHHHAGGADEPCNAYCEDRALERCYSEHGEAPSDTRKRVALAAGMVLMDRSTSHRQFLLELGVQEPLF